MHTVSKIYFRSLAALLSKNGNSPALLHSGGPTAAPRCSLRATQKSAFHSTSDNVGRYQHFCRPGLVPLLQSIGLDAIYERAEGDYLWQPRDDRLVPVLDLVGGYRPHLFGHHHPELVAVGHRHFEEKRP